MRYYLIAGEASGDLHGSNLIRGLVQEDTQAHFRLWGGDKMMEAAASAAESNLVRHYREGAVMGFTDVVRKIGKIAGNLALCRQDIAEWKPDVVILIDYPGFNLKIAEFCHRKGIKVFYYIAPKTWASREYRNRRLKEWVDKLFIVFPFEVPYFTRQGIPFIFKGNPLIDAIDGHDFQRPVQGQYVAILAGSRKGEISRMMPVCMQVADNLKSLPEYADCQFVVAGAPARDESDYQEYIGGREYVKLVFGRTYDVLKFADAAIINSGTASLEAALIGTPQVVCWSSTRLTVWMARHILRLADHIKFISLGNMCVDKLVFEELIQEDFTAQNVAAEIRSLIEDEKVRAKMLSGYALIRESLGGSGASRAVAGAMISELKK